MEYVAIYQNHKYLLGYFTTNGNFAEEWHKKFPTFLKTQVEKEVLDSIPNLGYSENEYDYVIWEKGVYETEKIKVPVYVKVFDNYKYTGKTHTFEVPTPQTIDAADKVVDLVYRQMELEMYRQGINKLQQLLENGNGICHVSTFDMSHISLTCQLSGKEILWSGRHQYIVGDPSMVTSLELKVYVPEKIISPIIGKGGKNVKEMALKMCVNKIHVLPLKKSGD